MRVLSMTYKVANKACAMFYSGPTLSLRPKVRYENLEGTISRDQIVQFLLPVSRYRRDQFQVCCVRRCRGTNECKKLSQ